jgi:hypothetical protein
MSNDIAIRDDSLFPSTSVWQQMKEQGDMLVATGFLPSSIKTGPQAVAIMLAGREIGVPPMQAMRQIAIIEGKPTISPELMLALILRRYPFCGIQYQQLDNAGCVINVKRDKRQADETWLAVSFTIEDAKRAGLAHKQNWTKYPRAMCRSRAISEMARTVFPDAVMGMSYTPEELGANVAVDANGQMEVIYEEPQAATKNAGQSQQVAKAPTAARHAATASVDALNAEFAAPAQPADKDQRTKLILGDFAAFKIGRELLEDYIGQRSKAESGYVDIEKFSDEHIVWLRELLAACKSKGLNGHTLATKLWGANGKRAEGQAQEPASEAGDAHEA